MFLYKKTWTSPGNRSKKKIDHICIIKTWKSFLDDVRTYRRLHTNNRLVVEKLWIKPTRSNELQRHRSPQLKYFDDQAKQYKYMEKIKPVLIAGMKFASIITEQAKKF